MRKLLIAVAVLTLIPGVASAGGGGDISRCPGFATGTAVSMLDSCFNGTAHFAPSNTTITISNDGALPHTFTAVDGSFNSGQLAPGETFELTVSEPGIIQVFCTLHGTAEGQGMAGVLVVGEAEPLPVSAQINVAAIKEVVAEEDGAIIEAIESQSQLLDDLVADQALLIEILEEEPSASAMGPTPSPAIVTVPVESATERIWVAVVSGLAAGLAFAALMTVRRSSRRSDPADSGKRGQPSLES